MIIAGTGHRPNKLGFQLPNPTYISVCRDTKAILQQEKPDMVITGMALGFDMWLAKICIDLNIPFIAAVPFPGQESKWNDNYKNIYRLLLRKAHDIVMVNDGPFSASKLHKRNEWMVDQCDKLIAVFNGSEDGGTFSCIQYAKKQDKEIIYIKP